MSGRCGCRAMLVLLMAATVVAAQTDSVIVPAKDYQKLLDELETARKAKAAKPMPPSMCSIECELKRTKDHPLALLKVTYQFRTSQPRSAVLLGGQRAFAVKASLDGGGPPALNSTADGLVAIVETAGEHSLIVAFETALASRGVKGDQGFDIGLPRAAITTVTLAGGDLKTLALGTRIPDANAKPGELKTLSLDASKLAKSYPLGPTDTLDLSWEMPKSEVAPGEATLDADVSVRVEETRVETTAVMKLRGPQKEWTLALPLGAELTGHDVEIVKPEPKKREWKVTLAGSEATVTASLRQPRTETRSLSVGPFFALGAVRQSGTVKLFAPYSLRLIPRPAADLHRVEQPLASDDSLAASFRYSVLAAADRKPAPLLDFDVRPASGFVVVQPQYKLALTSLGWKLRCDYRIAPVRTSLEQVTIELPAGWLSPTLAPLDLVDEVSGGGDAGTARTLTVRLVSPQREPFELTLESRWPLATEAREVSLLLPRLLNVRERESQVSVVGPESLELAGSVREWESGKVALAASTLTQVKSSNLSGTFESGLARLDLAWQPYRPKVVAEVRAEITLSERQITVQQTLKLSFPDGAKAIHVHGPNVAGFRSSTPLDSPSPGEWTFTPPAGTRDAVLTFSYSIVKSVENSKIPVSLFWPDATATVTTLRVWNANALRRIVGFEGAWRELPPEPSAERDGLPSLTLLASGAKVPLALELADADPSGSVVVERAVYQWWIADAGVLQGRARFLLQRWPGSLEIDGAGASGVTAYLDKSRVEAAPRGDFLRIPLPEWKPGRPTILLELRFHGPVTSAGSAARLDPPRLRGAVFRQPAWWQIAPPADSLPLVWHGSLMSENGWHWSRYGFAPVATASSDDLDRWLSDGRENDHPPPGDPAITGRQSMPAAVTFVRLPRSVALLVACGIVIGLGLAIVRLSSRWRFAVVGLLILLFAVSVVLLPQPASQLAFLLQPAVAVLALILLARAAIRNWLLQRDRQQATFARVAPITVPSGATIDLAPRRSGINPTVPVS